MNPKYIPISLEHLRDGKALEQINDALALCGRDVAKRPETEKPRTIDIKITITPQPEEGGLNYPKVEWKVDTKIPRYCGGAQTASVNRDGMVTIPAVEPEQTDIENITRLQQKEVQ